MSRHDHGDPDLPEEHAGGDPRRGVKPEQEFGMKMIGIVGVSLMISFGTGRIRDDIGRDSE